ncbi:MAG: glycosyltransferase family 39 protein [Ruminococcus sp.]|nr:glycosyltransferase family 39 protein [Ruminococcus sp.]
MVTKMLVFSFFIRIFLLLWDVYARDIFILPNSEADAVWYHKIAVSFAFQGRADIVDLTDYSYYVGLLYKAIGVQKVTVEFLHVFVTMWSMVLIYKIVCKFEIDAKTRKMAMAFVCFLPNLMIISTVFLQESVIAFFAIASLYLYTVWWTENKTIYFIFALLASAASAFLHTGGAVMAISFVVTYMLIGNKERELRITGSKLFLGVVLIFGLLFVMSTFGDTLFGKIGGELSAESITSNVGKTDRISDSDYSVGIKGLPPAVDIIVNSPVRVISFIFAPLPWMWRGVSDIVAFFGSALFYIYVFVLVIKALKAGKGKNKPDNIWGFFIVLVITWLIASLMFGWGVSNTGTALRHREKFTYICVVLFAVAKECIRLLELTDYEQKNIDNSTDIQGRRLPKKMR